MVPLANTATSTLFLLRVVFFQDILWEMTDSKTANPEDNNLSNVVVKTIEMHTGIKKINK